MGISHKASLQRPVNEEEMLTDHTVFSLPLALLLLTHAEQKHQTSVVHTLARSVHSIATQEIFAEECYVWEMTMGKYTGWK